VVSLFDSCLMLRRLGYKRWWNCDAITTL